MNDLSSVWKFVISVDVDSIAITTLRIPIGAKLLHVREQYLTIAMWFEVNPSEKLEERHFQLLMTGDNVPLLPGMNYLGTGMFNDGNYVLHVYERTHNKG